MKRTSKTPTTVGECEVGSIVRTPDGVMRVTGKIGIGVLVRLVSPESFVTASGTFVANPGLEVVEVLRDQDYYRTHPRRGGNEVDPLKGR